MSIPIIALSAHAMEGEMERSREAGCFLHLSRPIRKQVLLDTLAGIPGRVEPASCAGEKS